jgi:putative hydrolase of the HAD superfamily
MMFDWKKIDTILLDMDGTLLDLHFDNHFWLEYVPLRYAEKHGMSVAAAKQQLMQRYQQAEGTLDWYCVDYWSRELALDIPLLKAEVDHLIAIHPHVIDFLQSLKEAGKARILVTNAHQKALALKMKKTRLDGHLDQVISAHEIGLPKENHAFWTRLQKNIYFDPDRTLFIDDSLSVLRSAQQFGIRNLLCILQPDTKEPARNIDEFSAIMHFSTLTADLAGSRSDSTP